MSVSRPVQNSIASCRSPRSLFIALMMIAMMTLLFAGVARVVLAGQVAATVTAGVKAVQVTVQVWSKWLEGLR